MDEKQDKIELFKFRAEEYDKNYYSLRDIEWRRSLEALSGYVLIAGAYYALSKEGPMKGSAFLCFAGVLAPLLLFILYLFFSLNIQWRLHYTRNLRNLYVNKYHETCGVERLSEEVSTRPRFTSWYAFFTQIATHATVAGLIITYVVMTK